MSTYVSSRFFLENQQITELKSGLNEIVDYIFQEEPR